MNVSVCFFVGVDDYYFFSHFLFCFFFLPSSSFIRSFCLLSFFVVVVVELFVLKLTQHLMISSQPLLLLVYFLGSILEDIELIIIKCIVPQH